MLILQGFFFVEKTTIKFKESQCFKFIAPESYTSGNNWANLYPARVFRHGVDQPCDYMTSLFCSFDRPSCFLGYTHPQYFLEALLQCERRDIINLEKAMKLKVTFRFNEPFHFLVIKTVS